MRLDHPRASSSSLLHGTLTKHSRVFMRPLAPSLIAARLFRATFIKTSNKHTGPFRKPKRDNRSTMTDRPNAMETHDAITNKEIAGTEPGNQAQPAIDPASSKRPNACTPHCTPRTIATRNLNSQCSHRTHDPVEETKTTHHCRRRRSRYNTEGCQDS